MVRHKTRWLLVRIDFADDLQGKGAPTDDYPSKKDLAKVIRSSAIACSGVAASGAALDTQGKTFFFVQPCIIIFSKASILTVATLVFQFDFAMRQLGAQWFASQGNFVA
jgi:hypothetical protein